jgi:hypothetical protein
MTADVKAFSSAYTGEVEVKQQILQIVVHAVKDR